MRLDLRIARANGGWTVSTHKDGQALPPVALREVPGGLVLPTRDGMDPPPNLAPLAQRAPDAAVITTAGLYLWQVLLGASWPAITAGLGPADPIDIVLHFEAADDPLTHLPWEAMRTAEGALLADKVRRVSLVRTVTPATGAVAAELVVPLPLSVLFVVGAPLNDTDIRAGSEYLCIVERLTECTDARLHVLLDATPARIAEAIIRLRPTVVHFVAHGDVENGRPFLTVTRDKATDEAPKLFGDNLEKTLQWPGDGGVIERPRAVVLSACHTGANPKRLQLEAPLAAQLVSAGIALCVGMGGRVSDQACRLFARRFYEGLVAGGPIAAAAAEGRLAALRGGIASDQSLDWARPALFMAEGLVSLRTEQSAAWASIRTAGQRYRRFKDPAVYCGRVDLRERVRAFLRMSSQPNSRNVLAVVAHQPDKGRYGLSRTLERIAIDAIEDSWIPIDLIFQEGPDQEMRPKTQDELGRALWSRIVNARQVFGVAAWNDGAWLALRKVRAEQGAGLDALPTRVRDVVEKDGEPLDSAKVLRAALVEDLGILAKAAGRRPVVLLDDFHQYGEATKLLLKDMLDEHGLGRLEDGRPIPVVLAGSLNGNTEHVSGRDALNNAIQHNINVASEEIAELEGPGDRRLAYRVRLLAWNPPLVSVEGQDDRAFERMHVVVKGIPSLLQFGELETWLESVNEVFFDDATDDQLLRALTAE